MGAGTMEASWEQDCLVRERWEGVLFTMAPFLLHPLWVGFDYAIEPGWRDYIVLRVLASMAGLVLMTLLWRSHTLSMVRTLNLISALVVGWTTALLIPRSEAYLAYVLGYSLIIWGAASMFSTSWGRAVLMQLAIVAGYGLAHASMGYTGSLQLFISGGIYVLTAGFVGVFPPSLRQRLRRGAFEARWNLDQRNHELRSALAHVERTEAASNAKSAFLATMSHELRTPLNAILGYTELVLEDLPEPEHATQRADLGQVTESAQHLLGIIDHVLDLTRIESGKLELECEPVSLGPLIRDASAQQAPAAARRGNRVRVDLHNEHTVAMADAERLRQVITNLLSNAIKFTENGQIVVGTEPSGGGVAVYVSDTGIGIAPEAQERVFDRFYQVDGRSTREYDGTGLGLAISRELVHGMGGEIQLESTPGAGSRFSVTLQVQQTVSEATTTV